MNRVLFDAQECQADGGLCFGGARAEHLIQVLKVEPGDRFRAGLIDGPLGEAVVETVAPGRIEARLALEAQVPARPRVDLILALPRPKVLARMWASLASLGIGHLAFAVDDVELALGAIVAAGGGAAGEVVKVAVPGAGRITFVYATDPEGNIVELQHWTE